MPTRKKARLGRGLEALLGDVRPKDESQPTPAKKSSAKPSSASPSSPPKSALRELPIEQLQRGKYQPRGQMMDKEALAELAETIRTQGIIQPLLVRELKPNQYEIIAGERRWRAAQLAGLANVPAVVREVTDQNAMAVALIENIQRQDLNALEEAAGLQRLIEEFGLTHKQVAEAVGRSRAAVSNLLRLLGLSAAVKKQLAAGKLDMAHARTLLQLPAKDQPAVANKIIAANLSVRQTEKLVKQILEGTPDDDNNQPQKNADVLRLESDLSTHLGARVSIQHTNKKGKIIIHYNSLDELDGIVARVK